MNKSRRIGAIVAVATTAVGVASLVASAPAVAAGARGPQPVSGWLRPVRAHTANWVDIYWRTDKTVCDVQVRVVGQSVDVSYVGHRQFASFNRGTMLRSGQTDYTSVQISPDFDQSGTAQLRAIVSYDSCRFHARTQTSSYSLTLPVLRNDTRPGHGFPGNPGHGGPGDAGPGHGGGPGAGGHGDGGQGNGGQGNGGQGSGGHGDGGQGNNGHGDGGQGNSGGNGHNPGGQNSNPGGQNSNPGGQNSNPGGPHHGQSPTSGPTPAIAPTTAPTTKPTGSGDGHGHDGHDGHGGDGNGGNGHGGDGSGGGNGGHAHGQPTVSPAVH